MLETRTKSCKLSDFVIYNSFFIGACFLISPFSQYFSISADLQMALITFHETIIDIVPQPMDQKWVDHFNKFRTTTIVMNNIFTHRNFGTSCQGITTIYLKKIYKETNRPLARTEFYLFLTEFNEIEQ